MQPNPSQNKFLTITDGDWERELRRARALSNSITEQIKMKLHPSNPTPGLLMDQNKIKDPIDIREVIEVLDLIASELSQQRQSYLIQGAVMKLKQLKKKL